MGFWRNLAKSIFGSDGPGRGDGGLYFYVRLHQIPGKQSPQDEIVEIRVHPHNDLSLNDDGTYFVRKTVVGNKHFRRAELVIHFDKRRGIRDHEISGGELVTARDYDAYVEAETGE